jgi:hypothetical protein
MAEYNFEIIHRAGVLQGNADALSRRPCGDTKCVSQSCMRHVRRKHTPEIMNSRELRAETANEEKSARMNAHITTDEPLPLSLDIIREAQLKDPVIRNLFPLLRDPQPPSNVDTFGLETAHYWSQRNSLEISDNIIYRKFETAEGHVLHKQILVPIELRATFFHFVHADPTSGHFSKARSTEKLQHYAYWRGWRKDIELLTRRCEECCRYRKGPAKRQGEMQNSIGLAPFQKLHIDLTGPHRKSSRGCVYLLTCICVFTKYLITVPLRDKTAKSVATALWSCRITSF